MLKDGGGRRGRRRNGGKNSFHNFLFTKLTEKYLRERIIGR